MTAPPVTPAGAEARLKQVGLKPREPYVGVTRARWKVECSVCGHKDAKTLKQINEAIRCGRRPCVPCGREARYQTMIATGQIKTTCTLTDPITGKRCPKPHRSRGMCQSHLDKDRKYGDPFADGFKIAGSKRRKPVEEIEELLASIGHTMIGEYVNNKTPVLCRHTCGDTNLVNINNVVQGAVIIGCSTCGRANGQVYDGRSYTKHPTLVYLLKHSAWGALKVGICRTKNEGRRLHQHERSGFTLVQAWPCPTGAAAYKVEQEVLRHWHEDLNCPKGGFLPKGLKGAGHTETASIRKVGLKRTIDHIEALI